MTRIEIIAGPTASGKSALAMARAKEIGGTIINADSMQIYAALPILTAQPTADDRRIVPHRLYNFLPPAESCSAQRWRSLALDAIRATLDEGRAPIIVGGTGLYINALMKGLSPIPDVPSGIRDEAVVLQEKLGNPAFHAELAKRDSAMAARLHANDTQRLIRAYEVIRATGKSLAEWQALPREGAPDGWMFDVTLVLPERETLYDRCNKRFDIMLEMGALDEVKKFAATNDAEDAAVTHALGYRPLLQYLRNEISLDDAVILGKTETRQYAKRQVTWFRHQVESGPHIETIKIV